MSTVRPQNEKPAWFRYTAWRELILRRLMAAFASYRPELHYMRGPGRSGVRSTLRLGAD
jgi:hypothetical protein